MVPGVETRPSPTLERARDGGPAPAAAIGGSGIDGTIERLKAVCVGSSLGGLSWRAMRDEGRR